MASGTCTSCSRGRLVLLAASLVLGLGVGHAQPAAATQWSRGFTVPAVGIGSDYPVEALVSFAAQAHVGTVIVDWDCIPDTAPRTDQRAVNALLARLSAAGVHVAAMYRPRFRDNPTVPTQTTLNGGPAEHDGYEICYSDSRARAWGAQWAQAIVKSFPGFTAVLIGQPHDYCGCRQCGERPRPDAPARPGVVQFLRDVREALDRRRSRATLGLVGPIYASHWEPVLDAVDVILPSMTLYERFPAANCVASFRTLGTAYGAKMGCPLLCLSADTGRTVSEAYAGQLDRALEQAGISYVMQGLDTAFLSDEYDPQQIAHGMGLDWEALAPILGQMACAAEQDDGVPLLDIPEQRADLPVIAGRYAVVTCVPRGHPYYRAAAALAQYRQTDVLTIPFVPRAGLYRALQSLQAEQIALVAPPAEIVPELAETVFLAASTMDHDVALDFTYGFITGETPDDAWAMVQRTIEAEAQPPEPHLAACVGQVFDGMDHCYKAMEQRAAQYAQMGLRANAICGDTDDRQWAQRRVSEMPKFDGATAVVFMGHGSGHSSCGITGADLFGVQLNHAIAFSGTCYGNAVTNMLWDVSKDKLLHPAPMPPRSSVALAMIHGGAIGLVGSLTSSSFWFVREAMLAVDEGLSMGQAFARNADTCMAASRLKQVVLYPWVEGELPPGARGTRAHRQANTIAPVVLLGDPAYVPFPGGLPKAQAVDHPTSTTTAAAATRTTPPPLASGPEHLQLAAGSNAYVLSGANGVLTTIIQYLPERSFAGMARGIVCDNRGCRTLLKFDLSRVALPEGKTLRKVTLRLYAEKSTGQSGGRTMVVHRVTAPWDGKVTWGTMPTFEAAPCVAAPYETGAKWLELDITEPARSWLTDPAHNYGLLLKFEQEGQTPYVEWDFTGPMATTDANRPRLVFECD
ncbi:DNRLRE domain-containing protein [bacterium]|nr:DNRLRE domain-containing protein [bacterium]